MYELRFSNVAHAINTEFNVSNIQPNFDTKFEALLINAVPPKQVKARNDVVLS